MADFSGPNRITKPVSERGLPVEFGRYELTRLLAVGGMAEVFLARSLRGGIEQVCVIKRILPEFSSSRDFVSMFIDEARITIGLRHPNVVRLFDFGQVDGAYYMALEYVEGCDLVHVLRTVKARGEGVPPAGAAFIAMSMLRGLHYAHMLLDRAGQPLCIVHRDVSPQNAFLSWDGAVKIGDFGIADSKNKATRTAHGMVKGKYSYMSPEQIAGARVDGRADVWASGAVLWEMLVGARLFAGKSPVETLARITELPIPRPSEVRQGIPSALDDIVLRALSRRVADRYSVAHEMAHDLERWLHAEAQKTNGRAFAPEDLAALLSAPDLNIEPKSPVAKHQTAAGQPAAWAGHTDATVALPTDEKLRQLHVELRREQNVWLLVEIAKRHVEIGQHDAALSAARTAAAVFAHRGQLVSAICALHAMRALLTDEAFRADLARLATLRTHRREELVEVLREFDRHEMYTHVRSADPGGFGAEKTDATLVLRPTPLFGRVAAADFAELARIVVVEERPAGSILVEEGEPGDCLYAIGRGRVLVHCAPRLEPEQPPPEIEERIYVASLSEGDFFGEFSLLTRSKRSATVEAASDVVLLRIDRATVERMFAEMATLRDALVEFYKERVAELLLARNPLVGLLAPETRRKLLVDSEIVRFADGETIVEQGEQTDRVFIVMSGEVEITRDEDGLPIFLDKLRDGQLFGEMSVLTGGARTASVRAMGRVELLVIDGQALAKVLANRPDVRQRFEASIEARAHDTRARVAETTRIFAGV